MDKQKSINFYNLLKTGDMMCGKRFLQFVWRALPVSVFLAALLLSLQPIHSETDSSPDSSGKPLSSSEKHLNAWEQLSSQFTQTLKQHEQTLNAAYQKIRTLEINSASLTNLCETLLQQNKNLNIYSEQMGQRMQERDQELVWKQEEIDDLSRLVSSWRRRAFIFLGVGIFAGILIPTVVKLVRKLL